MTDIEAIIEDVPTETIDVDETWESIATAELEAEHEAMGKGDEE